MAEIRLFIGDAPPEPAQSGMIWAELQPGSGRWVELPESFVTVKPAAQDEIKKEEGPKSWTSILKEARASRANMPLWVWPGIPVALGAFKIARWFFRRRKAKA